MKKLLLNALFMGCVTLGFAQPTFTEKTFSDMRERRLNGNPNYLKDEVSPDFIFSGHTGQDCNMNCMIALTESATLLEWPVEQVKIRQVGNVAIVTGISHHTALYKKNNAKVTYNQRFTDTYEYKNGKWMWLTAQYTDIQMDKAAEEAVVKKALQDKEAEIRRLENLERESVLKGDSVALFNKIWSPNMVIHAPTNRIVTVEITKMLLRTGKLNYASFERTIEKITFNDNIAFVMGEEKLKPQGEQENAGKLVTRRFTNIWNYENNNWSIIARQATIIKVESL